MTVRFGNELLTSIIADIYDCAIAPEGWTAVLTRIAVACDAAYISLNLANTLTNESRVVAHSPWDAEQLRVLMCNYGFQHIPGASKLFESDIDTPWATLSNMPEVEFQKSDFYRDWVRPQGLRDACLIKFVHTPDRIGVIGCVTSNTRDIVSPAELHFLSLLSPHLRRAAMIGDLLEESQNAKEMFRLSVDRLGTPIVFTNSDGFIKYANASAEKLLADQVIVSQRNGYLVAQNPTLKPHLDRAINLAGNGDISLGSHGIGLPLTMPNQSPAIAYILPLSGSEHRLTLGPATVAIFISTANSASPIPEDFLITLFGLTPAEARLMVLIGNGLNLEMSATSLDITHNTAKSHMSKIFAKTGTLRQADVVSLVRDLSPPGSF